MRFTKKKISLQPIRQDSNIKQGSINKRGSSLHRNKAYSPNISTTHLPPVKLKNSQDQNHHECIKPRRRQSNLFMQERVKFDKDQLLRRKSYQSKKNVGLNSQQLSLRKQNYLNTRYNLRKNKLIEITKENKHIYERINSQKSLYSSKDFDKSFQSNCSLSRRLSQSKLSKISSRQSFQAVRQSGKGQTKFLQPKRQNQVQFGSKDICKGQTDKVYRYMSIFCNRLNLKKSSTEKEQVNEEDPKMTKCNKQNKLDPPIAKIQKINKVFSQRLSKKMNTIFLHHFV